MPSLSADGASLASPSLRLRPPPHRTGQAGFLHPAPREGVIHRSYASVQSVRAFALAYASATPPLPTESLALTLLGRESPHFAFNVVLDLVEGLTRVADLEIPPELLPFIFEPLARGPDRGVTGSHGIGLGLFIARAIVAAHGGDLDVASSSAQGTTFTVRLPRRGETQS